MSFRQKTSRTRNRRLSNVRQRRQQHLLDVKVRSRRATQHRIRSAMGVFWKLFLLVLLCAAGYAGAREAVKRLVFENPDYHVQTIELQTDGTLQREQVLKAADLHEGANIFSVNLARMRDRIQQLPQADEVEVMRRLPSEIAIRIVERKPVAWITSGLMSVSTALPPLTPDFAPIAPLIELISMFLPITTGLATL